MNRREFLKGIGAMLAGLFAPKKAENQDISRHHIDFYLPIPDDGVPLCREVDTGYREEALDNVSPSALVDEFPRIEWMPGEIQPAALVYITYDLGETWEYAGELASGGPMVADAEIEAPPAVSTYDMLGDFNEFVIAQANMPQWVTCQCGSQYWTGGDDAGVRCSNCGSPPEMSCFVDLAHD